MPKRILVVDDEQIALGAFERALQLRGYNVSTALSSAAALRLCEESSFDLVILDFIMPRMNGVELLVRIRKLQPLVRSIVISGKLESEVDERQVGKELGEGVEADWYLHKPVSAAKLQEVVASLLNLGAPEDWKSIAKQAVRGQQAKISAARTVAKNLRAYKKK
jgi:CheY-like chemotaxis protein